jgi:hypothetical protein
MGHVAGMGEMHIKPCLESHKRGDHLEEPGRDETIAVKFILKEYYMSVNWTEVAHHSVLSCEPTRSIRAGNYFTS